MAKRPNLLVLLSDQHNPHVLGAAGDAIVRTPHLDALAAAGTSCTSTYCPYPLCAPSRMGFLSGRHPVDIGGWDNGAWLPSDVPTFADALSTDGYETVLCGRMHFNGPEPLHGFEKRIHGDVTGGAGGHWLTDETHGAGEHSLSGQTRIAVQVAGHGENGYRAFDRSVTRRAGQFLRTRGRQREAGAGAGRGAGEGAAAGARPWCMVVGFILPHNPLICAREAFDYYSERLPEPEALSDGSRAGLHPAIAAWRRRRGVEEITPAQRQRARAAYYGLVDELDGNVGQVLAALEESGQADDTVVVYASDHGDMADEQGGMWWKSCFFEGSSGVPLIARGPGIVAGARVSSVASLLDIGPTLLDWAGAPALPEVEGRSIRPMLEAGAPVAGWGDEAFMAYLGAHGDAPSAALRSGRWKLMCYSGFDSCLLFDLVDDPGETVDRASDPDCAAVVAALLGKIRARWSAQAMVRGAAAAQVRYARMARRRPARAEGTAERARRSDNVFDFEQLPWADELRGEFGG